MSPSNVGSSTSDATSSSNFVAADVDDNPDLRKAVLEKEAGRVSDVIFNATPRLEEDAHECAKAAIERFEIGIARLGQYKDGKEAKANRFELLVALGYAKLWQVRIRTHHLPILRQRCSLHECLRR